ncbi:DUF1579 domain-containing protein [candidate division GN15 bacterium]|nr:DUF1579 domain-containing protein [candidate division GN15 bacterium]
MRAMRLTIMVLCAVLWIGAGLVTAQEEDREMTPELMAKYMAMAQPGPEHEHLAKLVGEWTSVTTFRMQPGDDPTNVEGTCHNEMVLEGRFLQSRGRASTPQMEAKSMVMFGYDRMMEEYTLVAFDTWGTYYITAAGQYDEESKSIRLYGEEYDPIMDFTQEYYFKLTFVDEDTFVEELYFTDEVMTKGLGEFKMVETTYTRVKEEK